MKRLLFLLVTFTALLPVHAEKPAWVCAIEWSEEKPEWVFVYEDVKLQADGCYRIFIKWEFTDDPEKSMAKQTWLISPDFDMVKVVKSVGYGKDGKVAYSDDEPYGEWSYVLPETFAEGVDNTTKEILLTR